MLHNNEELFIEHSVYIHHSVKKITLWVFSLRPLINYGYDNRILHNIYSK